LITSIQTQISTAWFFGSCSFQGVFIGLDLSELGRYSSIDEYFVGSGEYFDGARTANDLRVLALILSVTGFFVTAISLILSTIAAACRQTLRILTVMLVRLPCCLCCVIIIVIA